MIKPKVHHSSVILISFKIVVIFNTYNMSWFCFDVSWCILKMTTVLKEMRIAHPTVLYKWTVFTNFTFKLTYLRIPVNFDFRGFVFLPPSFNISTQHEPIFESRRQKIIEVCKKYKMNTGMPSSKIFDTILCFSKYEVSTYTMAILVSSPEIKNYKYFCLKITFFQ